MDQITLAYLAGLFDGEGSISISLKKGSGRQRPIHELTCCVTMTSESAVRDFQAAFGGDFGGPYCRNTGRHKPQFRWRIISTHALRFLQTIAPHLRIKRPQAEVGIAFQSTKVRHKILPQEEIERRESYRQQMIELNHRHGLRPKPYPPATTLDAESSAHQAKFGRFKKLLAEGSTTGEMATELELAEATISAWRNGRVPKWAKP